MQSQTFSWQSPDKLTFFGQKWQPQTPPKAVIAIVHGMGEHSGRYSYWVDFLLQNSYAVMGFDHRGHGKSEGQRGHTPNYERLLSDVEEFLRQVKIAFPDLPVFLFGHSMGGNVVLNYVLRRNPLLKGVIVSGAWLKLGFVPPAWQVGLAKVVNYIYPQLTQPTNLEVEAISRDAQEVEKYKNDPLVHGKTTPRFFLEGSAAAEWALSNAANFSLPLLLYHGGADRLTSPEGSKLFAQKVKPEYLTFKIWEDAYHELHNDLDRAQVFAWILAWLESR
ncbi:MAG: lysophospholipase [Microscillaceae bacterium]|jgi:alpha-beta hydrolase superfamily lysophospholipase|nr:lysophospholipase [Microscillaceae bacterium]